VTISDADAATWRLVQAVNAGSALWLVQAFTPGMAERRFGRILFITSVAPGLTDTPASPVVNTDEQFDATVDRQALRRRLTPDDTAAAVAYSDSGAGVAPYQLR
jgi:NAD(P)-dependent dehydrogenase (short-subunit alcohol dehydrogenase family)